MAHENIEAMRDQLEASMREMADILLKMGDLRLNTSQSLRMLSIMARFGEILGQDSKHPEDYDLGSFLSQYMEERDEE